VTYPQSPGRKVYKAVEIQFVGARNPFPKVPLRRFGPCWIDSERPDMPSASIVRARDHARPSGAGRTVV